MDFWSVLTDRARLEGSDGGGAEPSGVSTPMLGFNLDGSLLSRFPVSEGYLDGAVPEEALGRGFHS